MRRGSPSPRAPGTAAATSAVPPPSLGPTTTPLVTGAVQPDAVDALQQVLAGEHAVVWAYGTLGPRLSDPEAERAFALLILHQQRRDAVRAQLISAGAQPVVAEPAYDVPVDPVDPASAAELAALVEERLAAVYGDLVAASEDPDLRTQAVSGLVHSAVRAQSWAPIGTTFPGLPERANEP